LPRPADAFEPVTRGLLLHQRQRHHLAKLAHLAAHCREFRGGIT
jgi:hypothetical protein